MFRLQGRSLQLFQRVGLSPAPDGSVDSVLLVDDILPVSRLDGSILPQRDAEVAARIPATSDGDFAARADAFVRATVPDEFNGKSINFLQKYLSGSGSDTNQVTGATAVFGWPVPGVLDGSTSGDPNLYQRFERADLNITLPLDVPIHSCLAIF